MRPIGANMPRLHGFHRFLPRLWELFFAPFLGHLGRVLVLAAVGLLAFGSGADGVRSVAPAVTADSKPHPGEAGSPSLKLVLV